MHQPGTHWREWPLARECNDIKVFRGMVDTISTAASKMVLPLGHGSPNGYCTDLYCITMYYMHSLQKFGRPRICLEAISDYSISSKSCFRTRQHDSLWNCAIRFFLPIQCVIPPAVNACSTKCDEIFARIARWCTAADTEKQPQIITNITNRMTPGVAVFV